MNNSKYIISKESVISISYNSHAETARKAEKKDDTLGVSNKSERVHE